jgi:plasmid stabilization system protein ParE
VLFVRLSKAAERDLDSIEDWLTQAGAGAAAAELLERLFHAIRHLSVEAELWPIVDIANVPGHLGYRKRVVEEYVIVYAVRGPKRQPHLSVLRILGPGRRWP